MPNSSEGPKTLRSACMALGLKTGDRVGIWSANRSEWVLAQFGTALAGLILVNINPAYRAHEFDYAIRKSGCRALILSPGHKNNDYFASLRSSAPEIDAAEPGKLASKRLPKLEIVIRLGAETTPGMLNFDGVAKPATDEERRALAAFGAKLQFDDPINIQFTSGTTGAPKGATLTHHNIVNNGFFIGEAMRLTPEDRLCIPVPYYHCFGMVLGNLACVTHGACDGQPLRSVRSRCDSRGGRRRSDAPACTACRRCSSPCSIIPSSAASICATLRTGIMAGSPCPVEVMRRVVERMHMREVTIAYGMTETSPVSFQSAHDDPLERRVSTVGRIQPHLEVKIVDSEGRIVPPGVAGRASDPRLQRHARLLGRSGGDRQRDRRRRLHAYRRSRDHRRGRLLQHRRPAEGHDHPRRREHLPARDRGVPLHPPGRSPMSRRSAFPIIATARSSASGSAGARARASTRTK